MNVFAPQPIGKGLEIDVYDMCRWHGMEAYDQMLLHGRKGEFTNISTCDEMRAKLEELGIGRLMQFVSTKQKKQ